MNRTISSTRILPGLLSEYAIVALPSWAWNWIDDHVEKAYANDYGQFIKDARQYLNCDSDLPSFLSLIAEDLRDSRLRDMYHLANDNDIITSLTSLKPKRERSKKYPRSFKFPTIFQIFKFIPHATDMNTLWNRRHYHNLI